MGGAGGRRSGAAAIAGAARAAAVAEAAPARALRAKVLRRRRRRRVGLGGGGRVGFCVELPLWAGFCGGCSGAASDARCGGGAAGVGQPSATAAATAASAAALNLAALNGCQNRRAMLVGGGVIGSSPCGSGGHGSTAGGARAPADGVSAGQLVALAVNPMMIAGAPASAGRGTTFPAPARAAFFDRVGAMAAMRGGCGWRAAGAGSPLTSGLFVKVLVLLRSSSAVVDISLLSST